MVVEYWQPERWSHTLNTINCSHFIEKISNIMFSEITWHVAVYVFLLLSIITFVVGAVLHVTWQPKVSKHHTIDWRDQHISSCNVPVFQNIWVRPESKTETTRLSNKHLISFLKSQDIYDILINVFPFPVVMQNVDDSWNLSSCFTPESTTEIFL